MAVYSGHPALNISWKYDDAGKVVELNIDQKQNTLFGFPLQVAIDNKLYTINIKDKNTIVQLPVPGKPSLVSIDPDVNLLAGFELRPL
jgi:aminopeptidase N